jgi:hypothetical protein
MPYPGVEPVEVLTFLGVELDTIKMEMRLPQDKIIELTNRLKTCLDANKYPFVCNSIVIR